jgi:hypothetical protein
MIESGGRGALGSIREGGSPPPAGSLRAGVAIPEILHRFEACYAMHMANDDEAAKPPAPPDAPSRPSDDKLAEKLAERIRSSTTPPPVDDKLTETIRQRLEHLVPELVKKTFSAGMGAVFSTEEGIRRIAREGLPEVAAYIASSADGAKDKVWEIIARETRDFLANLNLTDEIAKILTTLSFEIRTEVRFIPNSEKITGAMPDVKASVRLKRNDQG